MTLADQRMRLIRSLGAIAARTSAEVTVVFDGAAVTAPPAAIRGVRVLFSPPGVIADQIVKDLAAAEPRRPSGRGGQLRQGSRRRSAAHRGPFRAVGRPAGPAGVVTVGAGRLPAS